MNITTNSHNILSGPIPLCSFFPVDLQICELTVHARSHPRFCVTLIDLNEIEDNLEQETKLPEQALSDDEQLYFKRFSFVKRRREWLGGRIAAKAAMLLPAKSGRLQDPINKMSILPDTYGRPVARDMQDIAISISHSNRFAVALAVKGVSCGVDLQKTSSKLAGLTDRFATDRELALLDRFPALEDQITKLTMLWATKEALKKSMLHDQPAFFSGIQVQRMTVTGDHAYRFDCSVTDQPDQAVMVYNFSPYIIALNGADHA